MCQYNLCFRAVVFLAALMTGSGIAAASAVLENKIITANELIMSRQFDSAEQILQEALETALDAGLADERLAAIWSNLGHLYRLSGRPEDAGASLRKAVELYHELGPSEQEANALAAFGAIAQDAGDYLKAENYYRQAILVLEQVQGTDCPPLAAPLSELASIELSRRRYTRAEALLERVLAIQQKHLGANHSNVAKTINHLGVVRQRIGDPEGAEDLYRRALAAAEPDAHPDQDQLRAAILHNLGSLLISEGDFKQAGTHLRQALFIWKRTLGERHPTYATGLANLGIVYYRTGSPEEAARIIRQALQITRNALGPDHAEVGHMLANYAVVLRELDRNRDARLAQRRSSDILERHAGANMLGATIHISDLTARRN